MIEKTIVVPKYPEATLYVRQDESGLTPIQPLDLYAASNFVLYPDRVKRFVLQQERIPLCESVYRCGTGGKYKIENDQIMPIEFEPMTADVGDYSRLLELLYQSIERCNGGQSYYALAFSGGVDSGLILSALIAAGKAKQVMCFIAKDQGVDAQLAIPVAQELGIRYHVVDLGVGWVEARNILSKLALQSVGSFALGGLSFYKVAKAAKDLGFTKILNGSGGEIVTQGTAGKKWGRYNARLVWKDFGIKGLMKLAQNPLNQMNVAQSLYYAMQPEQEPTMKQFLWKRLHYTNIRMDYEKLYNAAAATGIVSVSPFFSEDLEPYLTINALERFFNPIEKEPARQIMSGIVPDRLIWSPHRQGLKWNPHTFMQTYFDEVQTEIKRSSVLKELKLAGKATHPSSLSARLLATALFESSSNAFQVSNRVA